MKRIPKILSNASNPPWLLLQISSSIITTRQLHYISTSSLMTPTKSNMVGEKNLHLLPFFTRGTNLSIYSASLTLYFT